MSEYVTVWKDHEPTKLRWGVPIVRCRDCVHRVKDPDPIDPGWPMMCEDTGRDMVEPDGFCAWGECSECGCLTPDDSTYCINCGRKVES